MQFTIHVYSFTIPGEPESIAPTLARTARLAEEAGATGVTLMDHWFQMEQVGRAEEPMLEGYTALGYLAGLTERVTVVLIELQQNPRPTHLLSRIGPRPNPPGQPLAIHSAQRHRTRLRPRHHRLDSNGLNRGRSPPGTAHHTNTAH